MTASNLQPSDLRSNTYRSLPGDQDIFSMNGNGCDLHVWQFPCTESPFPSVEKSFSMLGNASCQTLCLGLPWEKLCGTTLKVCEVIIGLYCRRQVGYILLLLFIYLVDIHTIVSKKNNCFRHQAFVHIHILSLSKTKRI